LAVIGVRLAIAGILAPVPFARGHAIRVDLARPEPGEVRHGALSFQSQPVLQRRGQSVVDDLLVGLDHVRIVNTASGVGAFGMPASLPYATAKAAVFGLNRSAALDNLDMNIRINAVSPIAETKMGLDYRSIHPALDGKRMHVERVSPLVLYLAHEACAVTGEAFHVAGGRVAQIFTAMSRGFAGDELSPDQIAAHLDEIHDKTEVFALNNTREQYDLIPK
jgi:NAD(P)-dependent dehydrogenase (short-subunit alcohol dehydrogenase family)